VTENYYIITSNGELYHHGVKGMKWGVRRDARLLSNSRRNKRVRAAQAAYKAGKLTKEQRDKEIESARQDKKKTLSKIENDFANAKTAADRARLKRDLANKTAKEVPNATLKRGASIANALFGGVNAASIGLASASVVMINPAFAGVAVASAAVGVAAEAGYRYVVQLGLDKLS
jgi:hypothetical protein